MSEGRLLPKFEGVLKNNMTKKTFTAGDVRALENPGLSSLHTVFLREHNRIAAALSDKVPQWSDEELYQMTRRQSIMQIFSQSYACT